MTVQELIDRLMNVEDKEMNVYVYQSNEEFDIATTVTTYIHGCIEVDGVVIE